MSFFIIYPLLGFFLGCGGGYITFWGTYFGFGMLFSGSGVASNPIAEIIIATLLYFGLALPLIGLIGGFIFATIKNVKREDRFRRRRQRRGGKTVLKHIRS